jgi:hypothetical protein
MDIEREGRFFLTYADGTTELKSKEYEEFLKNLDEYCLCDLKVGVDMSMMMEDNACRFDYYQDKNLLIMKEMNRRGQKND